jgi:hypothetical protein
VLFTDGRGATIQASDVLTIERSECFFVKQLQRTFDKKINRAQTHATFSATVKD